MSLVLFLKNNLKNFNPTLGQLINRIPFSYRPGLSKTYNKRKREISTLEDASEFDKKKFIFDRVSTITNFAYENITFYKEHYDCNNFKPSSLKCFDDLHRIPIINKAILDKYNIEDRSFKAKDRYLVNTGGSSGTPFSLYIQPSSMGHEWGHMHYIWEELDYKPSDFKLVFGGRSDVEDFIDYDVVRNQFSVDIYADYELIAKKLKKILKKYRIKYLHGYPSSIYNFTNYCENCDLELKKQLQEQLKGVFLGSEYPHEYYRLKIENVFNVKTISWYGHTERAVLAYEKSKHFTYYPFLTYGYTEALETLNENDFRLLSTSYYNYASPLIRYDTEDIISDIEYKDGLLESFSIKKGRSGEEIIDKNGVKINLTGLIFGRHHKLFNYSKFIQVSQKEEGAVEIHYVSDSLNISEARDLFDSNNLYLDLTFVKRDAPYRTNAGKINLLIKE